MHNFWKGMEDRVHMGITFRMIRIRRKSVSLFALRGRSAP